MTILCSPNLHGQSVQECKMNIDELFKMAEENSKSISSYKTAELAANQAYSAAKASRLPDIEASLSSSYIGNGYLWNRSFKEGMSVDMPHWGNNFSLSAAQVVYAGGAINASIDIAELNKKMAQIDLHQNRQDVRFMLAGKYLDICKILNQMEVMKQNIELTTKLIDNTIQRANQGTALKNDIIRYELQLENMKLQLQKLQDSYSILNFNVVTTVGLPKGSEIVPEVENYNDLPQAGVQEQWQNSAEKGNVNIMKAETAVDINRKLLRIENSQRLPKIMFVAEEHLDGPILIEVPVINVSSTNYKSL